MSEYMYLGLIILTGEKIYELLFQNGANVELGLIILTGAKIYQLFKNGAKS
jgi:hypothetical protein